MHFSAMVFGDNVEQQLAPFQETNMGPIAPEHMERIDVTDEVHALFQSPQRCFRLSDGAYLEFIQAHHRDASGKMVLIPGAVAVEMCADEARTHRLGYATMDDAAEDVGAKREGDRFFVLDNLNSQWDWWDIGGRWGGMLKLLPGRQGYTAMPLRFDPEFAKILNRPPPEIWQPTPGYCDQARKKDIDWVGMQAEAGEKAGAEWDLVRAWTKGTPWSSWAEVRHKFTGDAARDYYHAQWAIKAIREGQQTLPPEQRRWLINDALSGTREDYVAAAEDRANVPHAVVIDGQWLDSDTVDQETDADWNKQFRAMLARFPDEAMVTIVDCHV
jgi:hypothetical protein